jgi:hypothetical protein
MVSESIIPPALPMFADLKNQPNGYLFVNWKYMYNFYIFWILRVEAHETN